MMMIYFLNGLSFSILGFEAFFQYRRGSNFPLRKNLPWLAFYGIACGISSWIEMFQSAGIEPQAGQILTVFSTISQPLVGLVLFIFGWRMLNHLIPLPAWTMFIPYALIVPIAFAIAYASTTFITPSPLEIPIDIWSRYFLYLPGSLMAGIGFLRQWKEQQKLGYSDVASLMLGAGVAFLFEAFVVGLVVPAAPYGPASYYNYDRFLFNAFTGEAGTSTQPVSLIPWLDYGSVMTATGLPIEFWRMLSTFAVTFFVVRGLDVFNTVQKREVRKLQRERDQAQRQAYETQMTARQTAENWIDTLIAINRRIVNLDPTDSILLAIIEKAETLMHSDFIGLAILNDDHSQLLLRGYAARDGARMVDTPWIVSNPLLLQAVQRSASYISNGKEAQVEREGLCGFDERTVDSFAIAHLDLENVPVGALWAASFAPRQYSDIDLTWLDSLADQVVIAIQHGLMTAQLQSLSIIEERGRIARDMHDGVAQVLGYMNVQLQTLNLLWKQGKQVEFQEEMAQMQRAVQSANADVRESILSLRTTLASDKGAAAAMAEYIQEFGLQTGIEIQFQNRVAGDINLSSLAEVQLVCILQEALTNVRKHAQAGQVQVILDYQLDDAGKSILLQVQDDGIGFEMHESRQRFGLKTMAERARSVNGEMRIQSALHRGTTLLCRLPCLAQEEITGSVTTQFQKGEPA